MSNNIYYQIARNLTLLEVYKTTIICSYVYQNGHVVMKKKRCDMIIGLCSKHSIYHPGKCSHCVTDHRKIFMYAHM